MTSKKPTKGKFRKKEKMKMLVSEIHFKAYASFTVHRDQDDALNDCIGVNDKVIRVEVREL